MEIKLKVCLKCSSVYGCIMGQKTYLCEKCGWGMYEYPSECPIKIRKTADDLILGICNKEYPKPIVFMCFEHYRVQKIDKWISTEEFVKYVLERKINWDDFQIVEKQCSDCKGGAKCPE